MQKSNNFSIEFAPSIRHHFWVGPQILLLCVHSPHTATNFLKKWRMERSPRIPRGGNQKAAMGQWRLAEEKFECGPRFGSSHWRFPRGGCRLPATMAFGPHPPFIPHGLFSVHWKNVGGSDCCVDGLAFARGLAIGLHGKCKNWSVFLRKLKIFK